MSHDSSQEPEARREILVAVGGPAAGRVVRFGKLLADRLETSWEAVHVETPSAMGDGEDPTEVAEALGLAAQLGASVASVPAATITEGLIQHLAGSSAGQLVIGHGRGRHGFLRSWRGTVVDELARRCPDLILHLVPGGGTQASARRSPPVEQVPAISYVFAVGAVFLTLLIALLLNWAAGVRSLSVLFLFPVVAAAARLGLRPALATVLLSVVAYNFFFVEPSYTLKPDALQSWVMGAVLLAFAIYVGAITSKLRGRLALSDRSAQENASIAAFALRLTRASDWTATGEAVCEQVCSMLNVHAIVLREVSGSLQIVASEPPDARLAPVDHAALDWAWANGEPAGRGTSVLSASDWQFQPLKTSLGTLAVLALAREDGANPVPADRAVLLSTLVAQASLAHERLRLEDLMKDPAT